jgi:hypothetical protein
MLHSLIIGIFRAYLFGIVSIKANKQHKSFKLNNFKLVINLKRIYK